jgi:hypothetical protein
VGCVRVCWWEGDVGLGEGDLPLAEGALGMTFLDCSVRLLGCVLKLNRLPGWPDALRENLFLSVLKRV